MRAEPGGTSRCRPFRIAPRWTRRAATTKTRWRSSALETDMSIRIGANPIGWSNDDLQEIGGDTPLETCIAEAKEAGVVGIEKEHGPGRWRGAEGEARFVRSRRRGWYRNPV